MSDLPPEESKEVEPEIIKASIQISFPVERHANIAFQALRADREPKRSDVTKKLHLTGNSLVVDFQAPSVRSLRTSMGGFLDSVILCQDTIKEFDTTITGQSIQSDRGNE